MSSWPPGVECRFLDEVDSTNAEAQRLALAGAAGPVWIVAQRQTRGRGRRGRAWSDHHGNFYGTLLFVPEGDPKDAALRSFTAALALQDALVALTGRPEAFALKWPNDVLLTGRKLAGILLEMCAGPRGEPQRLAIGFGVNLAHAPDPSVLEPGAVMPASVAEGMGLSISPKVFLDALAPACARWETMLRTRGFGPVRTAWLAGAVHLGEEIVARLPDREIQGIFRSIDASGAILLDTATGPVQLAAGDIHFRRADAQQSGAHHAAGH